MAPTSVAFGYDNANRRTTLTLPNGILLSYSYDNGSRVTAMSWMNGVTQVGDLEYVYDADGHVIEKTGSLASTGIPSAVSGNTFNTANEMTAFNGTTLTYDLNGNLLNDGSNTYTWDARNHLSTLTGSGTLPTSANFIYDPLGRRLEKTINQQTTAFLYDGFNPVQELMPSGLGQFAPTATMMTGLGIDEFFQRTDVNGAQSFVSDALGSTLALANAAGSISTSYAYEPFGTLTNPSATDTNPYQFTGRENDGTGLDYYRARYYSPRHQRFVSQDPFRLKGYRSNFYAYALNAPSNRPDPSGLEDPECEEIRKNLNELNGHLADALAENPVILTDVSTIRDLISMWQQKYVDLDCDDEGPDGGGLSEQQSCEEPEPYKQVAVPPPPPELPMLLLLLLLLAGSPVGV